MDKPMETPAIEIPVGHPHADDLSASYLFNETEKQAFDWSQNGNTMVLNRANWAPGGYKANSVNDYGIITNTGNKVIDSDYGTILMYIKSFAAFDDSAQHYLFRCLGGGAGFYLQKSTANTLVLAIDDGPVSRSVTVGEPEGWQTGVLIGVHWDKDKDVYSSYKFAVSANGVFLGVTASTNATAIGSYVVPDMYFLNTTTGFTPYFDGVCEYANFYKKNKSSNIVKDIYENPYELWS